MFTENEIATLIEIEKIKRPVVELKERFVREEAQLMEISDHDFLSLVMMTPAVGIALANGSVSLFEELALNKIARKMSKGGYFLKFDPVVQGLKYLIKRFSYWESPFYGLIKKAMESTFDEGKIMETGDTDNPPSLIGFSRDLMNVPYIFVRFLSLFFLQDEVEIVQVRRISAVEYAKVLDIGIKLDLDKFHVFQSFCHTFEVK